MAPTRVLRRTLEGALETRVASSILFEALGAAGQRVPQSRDEVLAVVRGPLREALERRVGAETADDIVRRIEAELVPAYDDVTTQELPLEDLAEETRRDADATATFPTADRAVPVLVIAAGRGFERRLAVALGDGRAAPFTVGSHEGLLHALGDAPPIVVVDATDFPAIDPERLLAAAASLPPTTTCVLWGADLPYGRNLARTLAKRSRVWLTLELREGIEPLLDLVRSRRKTKSA